MPPYHHVRTSKIGDFILWCLDFQTIPISALHALLAARQAPLSRRKTIDSAKRKARLQRAINMVFPYNEELCNAMIEEDFAGHTTVFSMMRDVCGSVISRKHARDKSDAWMPYQTRPGLAPLDNFGAIA